MAVQTDFSISQGSDGTLTISLSPPLPIGGWTLQTQVVKYFGASSGLLTYSMASGYYNVSGMNITNSGQGVFRTSIRSVDMSGIDCGAYSYRVRRLDSGSVTTLSEGYFLITP